MPEQIPASPPPPPPAPAPPPSGPEGSFSLGYVGGGAFMLAVLVVSWLLMLTVPAHNFWAPTRAKLMAALRSMPAVDGTLGSS